MNTEEERTVVQPKYPDSTSEAPSWTLCHLIPADRKHYLLARGSLPCAKLHTSCSEWSHTTCCWLEALTCTVTSIRLHFPCKGLCVQHRSVLQPNSHPSLTLTHVFFVSLILSLLFFISINICLRILVGALFLSLSLYPSFLHFQL